MATSMFDKIIDAFTDEGETRGAAVEVTPIPAGRMRDKGSPRVDASHLLQKIGITDPDKTRFIVETLGFDAAEDLYHTGVEDWTNLNTTYNGNLRPKDIDLLAGLCMWYGTFSDFEKSNETFDPFVKHRLVNQREYLLIIAELKTARMKSPRVDDRELNRSILSHISKLSKSFRSESQASKARGETQDQDGSIIVPQDPWKELDDHQGSLYLHRQCSRVGQRALWSAR